MRKYNKKVEHSEISALKPNLLILLIDEFDNKIKTKKTHWLQVCANKTAGRLIR